MQTSGLKYLALFENFVKGSDQQTKMLSEINELFDKILMATLDDFRREFADYGVADEFLPAIERESRIVAYSPKLIEAKEFDGVTVKALAKYDLTDRDSAYDEIMEVIGIEQAVINTYAFSKGLYSKAYDNSNLVKAVSTVFGPNPTFTNRLESVCFAHVVRYFKNANTGLYGKGEEDFFAGNFEPGDGSPAEKAFIEETGQYISPHFNPIPANPK